MPNRNRSAPQLVALASNDKRCAALPAAPAGKTMFVMAVAPLPRGALNGCTIRILAEDHSFLGRCIANFGSPAVQRADGGRTALLGFAVPTAALAIAAAEIVAENGGLL